MQMSLRHTLLLTALLALTAKSQISTECFAYFTKDHISFDMRALNYMPSESIKSIIVIDGILTEGQIVYDFCHPLKLSGQCAANFKNSHAYFTTDDGRVCLNLLSSHSSQNDYKYIDPSTLKTKVQGYKVFRKKPDFEFVFECFPDAKTPIISVKSNVFTLSSVHVCGQINERARLLESYRISFSIFLFMFGFATMLFGYFKKYWFNRLILFTIFFYTTFFLITEVFWAPSNDLMTFAIFLFSFFVGIVFWYLKIKNERFTIGIIGFAIGAIIGQQILLLLQIKATDVRLSVHFERCNFDFGRDFLRDWSRVQRSRSFEFYLILRRVFVRLRNGVLLAVAR